MQVSSSKISISEVKEDILAILLEKGGKSPQAISEFFGSMKKDEFEGKEGQVFSVQTLGKAKFSRLLLVGLGEEKDLTPNSFRAAAGAIVRHAKSTKCSSAAVHLPESFAKPEFAQAMAEGAILANYKFTKFKTKKEDKDGFEFKSLVLLGDGPLTPAIEKGVILAKAQNYVREIDEHPANLMTPVKLGEIAKLLGKEKKFDVKVYGKEEIKKMGMNGILAVNQGSDLPPVFTVMEYNKNRKDLPFYCVVGKGVTFDSGGISLKPSKGMQDMKYDKTGAVVTLGVMKAAIELKLPIHLMCIFPATENMPSGSAQKPGDIIVAYGGKTIEVLNTDAEGRLVLADALAFAAEKKPNGIIDIATLTGAIAVCFGPHAIGLFSNDDKLAGAIEKAGEATHERVWRMPIWKEYADFIKADFADIKNTGSEMGEASSITASKFLQEFVGENKWAHLDIAGVDLVRYPHPYLEKGASGMGVRLVINALERLAKK
jgi:leucyl aminopeptidase